LFQALKYHTRFICQKYVDVNIGLNAAHFQRLKNEIFLLLISFCDLDLFFLFQQRETYFAATKTADDAQRRWPHGRTSTSYRELKMLFTIITLMSSHMVVLYLFILLGPFHPPAKNLSFYIYECQNSKIVAVWLSSMLFVAPCNKRGGSAGKWLHFTDMMTPRMQ
jgi:hypothetical protein